MRSIDYERGTWFVSHYKETSYGEIREALRNNLIDLDNLQKVSGILSELTIQNEDRIKFNAYNFLLDHLLDETDDLLVEIAERFY